jgi:hypothetical protein
MLCLPKSNSPISADLTRGYESDRFSQGNVEILQKIILRHE